MNKLATLAAVAALSLAASATAAFAADFKVEGRVTDSVAGDSAGVKLNYGDELFGRFNYDAELAVTRSDVTDDFTAVAVGEVNTDFAAPFGVTLTPAVELGYAFGPGTNYGLWGAELTAKRAVYGPVSASVGLRHREGFDDADLREDRWTVGLEYALSERSALGVNYYDTNGLRDSTAWGVSYKLKF